MTSVLNKECEVPVCKVNDWPFVEVAKPSLNPLYLFVRLFIGFVYFLIYRRGYQT